MSEDFWGWLRFGMSCLSVLGGGFLGWIFWSFRKAFVGHKECECCRNEMNKKAIADQKEISKKVAANREGLDEKTADLEKRVAKNEDALKHLPTKDSTHEIELQLAGVRGDLKALTEKLGSVEALNQQVSRIEEYLLNKRG